MFSIFKAKAQQKTLGQQGEEFAQKEYKKCGYKILAANFFNKKGKQLGEVDFIALGQDCIIFVEVKTRQKTVGRFGTGAEAVNAFKQRKLLKAVKMFLAQYSEYVDLRPQIDVCAVLYNELDNPPFSAKIIANAVEDWN